MVVYAYACGSMHVRYIPSYTDRTSSGHPLLEIFSKTRMRQPARNSGLYQLNVSRAPELRCVNSPVKSCGVCESCKVVTKLNHTKEWFDRCGETVKRKYVLNLAERFESMDLLEYVTSLLQSFQYKDFTYMRSRSKPSLIVDTSCPPSNHALSEDGLTKTVDNYLEWFSGSTYWTKANYLLGLMQMCDTHVLYILATRTRTLYDRERQKQRFTHENGLIDSEDDEYASLCSFVSSSEASFPPGADTESHKSQPSKSTEHLSGTSGVHDIQTPDIFSTKKGKVIEQRESKFPGGSTANSASSRGFISALGYIERPAVSPSHTRSIPTSRQSLRRCINEMTDFEREFFSEDYMSGGEEEDGNVFSSEAPLFSGNNSLDDVGSGRFKDFIRCLPVHLSKCILGMLDRNSLTNCLCLSTHWRLLAEEVKQDCMVHQIMAEEIMLMQGASAKGMDPRYAKFVSVHVPLKYDENTSGVRNLESNKPHRNIGRNNLKECYEGIPTKEVKLEERNVYCGAYNVLVLQDMEDPNRCANFSGGRLVVSGSYDRRVRLIDASTGRCERSIQGHAGSIRCVYVSEDKGIVLSGGYDTSIRCWGIARGNCKFIFRGHRATVLCLALHGNHLASGSRDKSVKVWNLTSGKCRRTFRHRHVVLTVDVSDTLVVSGCEGGKVKVWDIEQAFLLKSLDGHHGAITSVKFDDYHIITGSLDCYAMAWSSIGKHKKCLQAFRHPKEVLCVEFLYCRVITGSADGKLRIWNLLNGDCLRIIRGNSKNDAITTIRASADRMIVNTLSNLLIFNFEAVEWNYNLEPERPEGLGSLNVYSKTPPRRLTRAHVRAQKLMRADTKDSLASRPPSRAKSRSDAELSVPHNLSYRILSAPPRLKHQESTLNSINAHVKRILSAHRDQKACLQSSLTVAPACKSTDVTGYNVTPVGVDVGLKSSMIITDVQHCCWKSQSFPDNGRSSVITRSRSAPAYRTQTLPAGKRGWTTSASGPLKVPENKIMVTADQARQKAARLRPHSAKVLSKKPISVNPVKSLSCLNLKTYSGQLQFEHDLRQDYARDTNDTSRALSSGSSVSSLRPKTCIPCVR